MLKVSLLTQKKLRILTACQKPESFFFGLKCNYAQMFQQDLRSDQDQNASSDKLGR